MLSFHFRLTVVEPFKSWAYFKIQLKNDFMLKQDIYLANVLFDYGLIADSSNT